MKFILAGFLILSSTAVMAQFSMVQVSRPSGGFLTGVNGADFLLDGSSGKLTAQ